MKEEKEKKGMKEQKKRSLAGRTKHTTYQQAKLRRQKLATSSGSIM